MVQISASLDVYKLNAIYWIDSHIHIQFFFLESKIIPCHLFNTLTWTILIYCLLNLLHVISLISLIILRS